MRKSLFLMAIALLSATFVSAQNYMVVNSEKVFKSLTAYNNALETLDDLAESYQNTVDQKFAAVEQMYNSSQRATVSSARRLSSMLRPRLRSIRRRFLAQMAH